MTTKNSTNTSTVAPSVKQFAQLAHIPLSDEQVSKYQASFGQVMQLMSEVAQLDLSGVESTSRVTSEGNVFREDIVEQSLTQEEALANAPATDHGFFVVADVTEGWDE